MPNEYIHKEIRTGKGSKKSRGTRWCLFRVQLLRDVLMLFNCGTVSKLYFTFSNDISFQCLCDEQCNWERRGTQGGFIHTNISLRVRKYIHTYRYRCI